ncbi:MAG: hypothetical protein H0U75_00450 [Legionella sp.]|nr:hypothetical protein [Legionella sp.]
MSDFITCDNNQLTAEQIIAALLTKDANGENAIRVMFVDACATDAIDCENNQLTIEQGIKGTLGISDCGKVALRLALPKGSFLNDIDSYVDDVAAAAGGLWIGDLYFNTTTGKAHARMA